MRQLMNTDSLSIDELKTAAHEALDREDYGRALQLFEDAGARVGGAPDVELLCDHARALHAAGRISEAVEKTETAMQAIGHDPDRRAEALRLRANARIVQRQFAGAEADLLEVVSICRDRREGAGTLSALRSLASALAGMGRIADASTYLTEAAAACRSAGGPHGEARARAIEGYQAFIQNRYPEAKAHFEAALKDDPLGDSVDATVPYLLARTCIFTGELAEAGARFRELVRDYHDRGAHLSEACMQMYLGEVALECGDLDAAAAHGADGERMLLAQGLDHQEDLYLRRVRALRAEVAAERGDKETAEHLARLSRPGPEVDFALIGRWPRSVIWRRIGRVHHLAGAGDQAESAFARAAQIGSELREWEWARSTLAAAAFHAESGDPSRARREAEAARDAFQEMGSAPYASRAATLLERLERGLPSGVDVAGRRQALLYQALAELTAHLDLARIVDQAADRVLSATPADCAAVALRDAGGVFRIEVLRMRSGAAPGGEPVCGRAVDEVGRTGAVLLVEDVLGDARFEHPRPVRSLVCLPLEHSVEGVVGALYADSRRAAGAFGEDDRTFLDAFAKIVAIAVVNARAHARVQERARLLQQEVEGRYRLGDLVGRSPAMQEVFSRIDMAAQCEVTVLLTGETGTGKDVAARAIHYNSSRKHRLFVAQSCATLRGDLLHSELFGHRKGAFTGAVADRLGLFEAADGGSIFLDEVGDATPDVQTSLLRVLETGEFRRLGETRVRHTDVRVIAATNRDLVAAVEEGRFREDLYYRLKVLEIEMPPLRDRLEDVPLLAEHLLTRAAQQVGRQALRISDSAMRALVAREWHGNVRELYNVLQRAAALAPDGGVIGRGDVSDADEVNVQVGGTLREQMQRLEEGLIRDAMERHGGNITHAAEELGMSRYGLQKKLRKRRVM